MRQLNSFSLSSSWWFYSWVYGTKWVRYWRQRPLNPETCISLITEKLMDIWVFLMLIHQLRLPRCTSGKAPTCQFKRHKGRGFHPWVRKVSWRRARQHTPVFLPGESNGQRSRASYIVHRVAQTWTWLKRLSTHTFTISPSICSF